MHSKFPLSISMCLAVSLVIIREQRTACIHYYEPVCYIPHPRGPYCGDWKSERRKAWLYFMIYNWYSIFALVVLGVHCLCS